MYSALKQIRPMHCTLEKNRVSINIYTTQHRCHHLSQGRSSPVGGVIPLGSVYAAEGSYKLRQGSIWCYTSLRYSRIVGLARTSVCLCYYPMYSVSVWSSWVAIRVVVVRLICSRHWLVSPFTARISSLHSSLQRPLRTDSVYMTL